MFFNKGDIQPLKFLDNNIMANRQFDAIAKEQFRFLESDYGCKLTKCQKTDWGFEMIYISPTTGIKITYEFQQAYIFITLYQLINGNLIENSGSINKDSLLFGYGLDDIISLRNPSALIKPAYQYGENSEYYNKKNGLLLFVAAFAKNLKDYAADIISGNFDIFKEADKIVKERVRTCDGL